jgi:hypothetical protein
MPSFSDYVGAFTGSGARDAAREAANIQAQATEKGIQELRLGGSTAKGYLDPYAQAGRGGLDLFVDYLGGRDFTASPYAQQQIDRGVETANRLAAGMGMGGGARAKRLMNEAMLGANQFRQQEMNSALALGQMGQSAATNQAQSAMNTSTGVANLLGSQGAAQAAGVIGEQNAMNQGLGNIIQGAMAVGGAFTPAAGTTNNTTNGLGGGAGVYGSGTVGGNAKSNPSGWGYQSAFTGRPDLKFRLGDS